MSASVQLYLPLLVHALVPPVVAAVLYLIWELVPFCKKHRILMQIFAGLVFGGLAVLSTEKGIDIGGAAANVRDAAALCAGLLFGANASVLAGLIGGVEHWFAAAWGVGAYSRIAGSVSTVLAGLSAAFLHKYLFDKKHPHWIMGFITGAVMEVLHMTVLFITHLDAPETAFNVVQSYTAPMMLANGVSVMIAVLLTRLAGAIIGKAKHEKRTAPRISQQVQVRVLFAVIVCFCFTTLFVYALQTNTAENNTKLLLRQSISDLTDDITDESDAYALELAEKVARELDASPIADLRAMADKYGVSDIFVVDAGGIVVRASGDFLGFDMASDADLPEEERQSSLFLVLLDGETKELVQPYRSLAADSSRKLKLAGHALATPGFVQIGLDGTLVQKDIAGRIRILAENHHIGETGFILVADENGALVAGSELLSGKTLEACLPGVSALEPGTAEHILTSVGTVTCMTDTIEGFRVAAVLPEEEVYENRNAMVYVNSYMEILVFAAMFVIIYLIVRRIIVEKLQNVNRRLDDITGGNLNASVEVRSSEEFEQLSDSINSTVDALKGYIDEAAARIDRELAFAKQIQYAVLPSVFPPYPERKEFALHASMNTAKEVGGDFYDFFFVAEDKLAVLVADVSGKGIPAAMFMMRAKTTLKNLAETGRPVSEVFTDANNRLCEGNEADMFVTCWMAIVDLSNGHVTFVNAGHNPPVLYRKGEGFTYLRSKPNLVLACMEGIPYREQTLELKPGDRIFLYTDGVTEAMDVSGALYGEARLQEYLNANTERSAEGMISGVSEDIAAFAGEAQQADDITMLMLDYFGKPREPARLTVPAESAQVEAVTEFLERILEEAAAPMSTVTQIDVAADEIFSNICKFAYGDAGGEVTVSALAENGVFTAVFRDSGIPYDPLEHEDPDITQGLETREVGGLGILIVKKTMDEVAYEYAGGQNVLTVRKKL